MKAVGSFQTKQIDMVYAFFALDETPNILSDPGTNNNSAKVSQNWNWHQEGLSFIRLKFGNQYN